MIEKIGSLKRLDKPYVFSKTSKTRLSQCHPLIQEIITEAAHFIDFSILEGSRSRKDQEAAYKSGNSKARFGESAHNYTPSLAIDIAPYPIPKLPNGQWDSNSKAWDEMAQVVLYVAGHLKPQPIDITWGGNFKSLVDKPHFELTDWKTRRPKLIPAT